MYSLLLLALCDWNRAIHLLTNAAVLGNTACMSVCTCICFALLIHKLFSAAFSELPSLDSNNHIYLAGLFSFESCSVLQSFWALISFNAVIFVVLLFKNAEVWTSFSKCKERVGYSLCELWIEWQYWDDGCALLECLQVLICTTALESSCWQGRACGRDGVRPLCFPSSTALVLLSPASLSYTRRPYPSASWYLFLALTANEWAHC